MAETIFVQSARSDNRVVLSEVHPDHPNGEVYIAGAQRNKLNKDGTPSLSGGAPVPEDNVVEVALTPRVRQKLAEGQLVEVKVSSGSNSSKSSSSKS